MAAFAACVVVGVALGAWGWGQRDEARDRLRAEAAAARAELEREADATSERAVACEALRAAAALDPDRFDILTPSSSGPGGPPPTTVTGELGPVQVGTLIALLDPANVAGVEGLDDDSLTSAMEDLRAALDAAQSAGADVAADPEVRAAADRLGFILDVWC